MGGMGYINVQRLVFLFSLFQCYLVNSGKLWIYLLLAIVLDVILMVNDCCCCLALPFQFFHDTYALFLYTPWLPLNFKHGTSGV